MFQRRNITNTCPGHKWTQRCPCLGLVSNCMACPHAPAVGPLGPALVPSSPKGSGWPDGALRNVKVRAWHLGQTGRVRHTEWECRPRLFSQPAAGAVLNFRRIVQPGPQPCLEALPSRYLEWASFRSLIERSSMAAIPTPRSSLRGRLAEALGCRQPRCVLKIARGLLLQQQSERSRHAPHRSGVAAKFGGYPRCANSLPGEPD